MLSPVASSQQPAASALSWQDWPVGGERCFNARAAQQWTVLARLPASLRCERNTGRPSRSLARSVPMQLAPPGEPSTNPFLQQKWPTKTDRHRHVLDQATALLTTALAAQAAAAAVAAPTVERKSQGKAPPPKHPQTQTSSARSAFASASLRRCSSVATSYQRTPGSQTQPPANTESCARGSTEDSTAPTSSMLAKGWAREESSGWRPP